MTDGWGDSRRLGKAYNRRFILDLIGTEGMLSVVQSAKDDVIRARLPGRHTLHNAYKRMYSKKIGDIASYPSAVHLKAYLGPAITGYFVFCFVRNPYAKAVSDWRWRTKRYPHISFLQFMERAIDPRSPDKEKVVPYPVTNWEIYTVNDKPICDFIGRLENFYHDIALAFQKLGVPYDPALFPHAKNANVQRDYRRVYCETSKKYVETLYEKELNYFSYCF